MDINNVNKKDIPETLLKGLSPYLLLDFFDFPYLTVEINKSGSYFLNYYLSGKGDRFNRILIQISYERLKLFLAGDLSLKQCFDNPENDFIYYAVFDQSDKIISLSVINENDFVKVNPIPHNYTFDLDIDFSSDEVSNKQSLVTKSTQVNKTLVDIYLQAPSLKTSLKYWALKYFLIPFTEIVRTCLLNDAEYTSQSLDGNVSLGFNRMQLNSLATTLEISSSTSLFGGDTQNDENLQKLFILFKANDEEELVKGLDNFNNKKIVIDYLKILNVVVKNNANLNTKLATPGGSYVEINLDRKRATILKKIIDEKIPNVEDTEPVVGTLLELAFDKKNPTFGMRSSTEDFEYKGHISPELTKKLKESPKDFVFFLKDYNFLIHTKYTPSTSKATEKIIRTLLDITDIIE